jgi:hypothetical protein
MMSERFRFRHGLDRDELGAVVPAERERVLECLPRGFREVDCCNNARNAMHEWFASWTAMARPSHHPRLARQDSHHDASSQVSNVCSRL